MQSRLCHKRLFTASELGHITLSWGGKFQSFQPRAWKPELLQGTVLFCALRLPLRASCDFASVQWEASLTSTIGTSAPLSTQCPQQHVGLARSLALQCGPGVTLGISPERDAHSLPVTLRQAGRAQRMFRMTSPNGYDQMTIFLSPRESGSWRSLL